MFKEIRWASNNGDPVCPACEHTECWSFKSRKIFRCRKCSKHFSVTSDTVFANRKLPIRDYLLAITIFVNANKGIPVLQLSRDLDVQYKTAFVMAHKIRESLGRDIQKRVLKGKVEVDGAYFGGYIKPANNKVASTKKLNIENKGGQHVRSDLRTCIPR